MTTVNKNFLKLPGNYLFSEIAKKVTAFEQAHKESRLIRLQNRRCNVADCSGCVH